MLSKKRSKKESTIISDKNKINAKIIETKKQKVEKQIEPITCSIAEIPKVKDSSEKVKSNPITLTSFFKKSSEESAITPIVPCAEVEDNSKKLIESSKENRNSNSNLKQPKVKKVT